MAEFKIIASDLPSNAIEELIRFGVGKGNRPPTSPPPPPPRYVGDPMGRHIELQPLLRRETISRPAAIDYTHRSEVNGVAQFARINMKFEPLPLGSGFVFENSVAGEVMPKKYLRGIEEALGSSAERGIVVGAPTTDMKVTLLGFDYDLDASSVSAFRNAARAAFAEGVAKAVPKVVEPIVRLKVLAPEDHFQSVMDDLSAREVKTMKTGVSGDRRAIEVTLPLTNILGYAEILDQKSNGHASFTAELDHFAPLPKNRAPKRGQQRRV
jgi:elongation factor G